MCDISRRFFNPDDYYYSFSTRKYLPLLAKPYAIDYKLLKAPFQRHSVIVFIFDMLQKLI